MVNKKQLFVIMLLSVSVCFAADNASDLTDNQKNENRRIANLCHQASRMLEGKGGLAMIIPKDNTVTFLEGSDRANPGQRFFMTIDAILRLASEGKMGTPVNKNSKE